MALFHETHENIPNFSKFSKPPCYSLDKSFPIYKKFSFIVLDKKPSQEVDGRKKFEQRRYRRDPSYFRHFVFFNHEKIVFF